MSDATATVEIDGQYRALREEAGLLDRSERGKLFVRGADSVDYLQSQITNDIEALEANQGCYAALLDRKGHLQADMRVLHLENGDIWLDAEPAAIEPLRSHLDKYKIGREVEIADESADWAIGSLIGPRSPEFAGVDWARARARPALPTSATGSRSSPSPPTSASMLITRADTKDALRELLLTAGAVEVSAGRGGDHPRRIGTAAVRMRDRPAVDAGRGRDHRPRRSTSRRAATSARSRWRGSTTRASRTATCAGCGSAPPPRPASALRLGEKQVGEIGTACISPALGPIALAIVRREAEPGDGVGGRGRRRDRRGRSSSRSA